MYFDFEDGHPDLARVPSALTAREGVLLSIIVHLAIALVAVLLPETDWWKAREAERQAELERIQAAVVAEAARPAAVRVHAAAGRAGAAHASAAGRAALGPRSVRR